MENYLLPLTHSLVQPRVAQGKTGNLSTSSVLRDQVTLATLRVDDLTEARRTSTLEAESVRSLPDVVSPTSISTRKMSGVDRMMEERKAKHEGAKRAFEMKRSSLYSELEDEVLRLGRELTASFKELDKGLEGLLQGVREDSPASPGWESHGLPWLSAKHQALEGFQARRVASGRAFIEALKGVEVKRSSVIRDALLTLASELTRVGYELPPQVSRAVEGYSDELNLVLLNNGRACLESTARVERAVENSGVAWEGAWKECRGGWRERKHAHALGVTVGELNSGEFTHPPARTAALEGLGERLLARHEGTRSPLLNTLLTLRPPHLTPLSVAELKGGLEEVGVEDSVDIKAGLTLAHSAQEASLALARGKVEALREVLHDFEAFAPSGDLPRLGGVLGEEMESNPALESLFRRAGGLKMELTAMVESSKSKDVIYAGPLMQLEERVALLVDSFSLGPTAVAHGKGSEKVVLLKVLDSLRSAKRVELPSLLVQLHRLFASLSTLPDLPPRLVTEMEAIQDQLAEVIEEIHDSLVESNLPVPPAVLSFLSTGEEGVGGGMGVGMGGGGGGGGGGNSSSNSSSSSFRDGRSVAGSSRGRQSTSRPPTTTARKSSRSRSRSPRGSGGGASQTRSRRTGSQRHSSILSEMGDAASSIMGQALPLPLMRAIQKRAGAVVAAGELPAPLQVALRGLLEGCAIQGRANATVDNSIAQSVCPVLDQREREGVEMLAGVKQHLAQQASRLRSGGEALCTYMSQLAAFLIHHANTHDVVDIAMGRVIEEEGKLWGKAVEGLEGDIGARIKGARECPSMGDLEEHYEGLVAQLDKLGGVHREYKDKQSAWAKVHVLRVDSCIRVSRATVFGILGVGMDPDTKVAMDGEEIPGEGGPGAALSWTRDGPIPKPPKGGDTLQQQESPPPIPDYDAEEDFECQRVEADDRLKCVAAAKRKAASEAASSPAGPLLGAATTATAGGSAAGGTSASGASGSSVSGGSSRSSATFPTLMEVLASQSVLAPLLAELEKSPGLESQGGATADETGAAPLPPLVLTIPTPPPVPITAAPLAPMELQGAIHPLLRPLRASPTMQYKQTFTTRLLASFLCELGGEVGEGGLALADLSTPPSHPPPLSFLPPLRVDVTATAAKLSTLRADVITHFEQFSEERRAILRELATARCASAYTHLEATLHSLAPRPGTIAMRVKFPRERELIDHSQKLERWVIYTGEALETLESSVGRDLEGVASVWRATLEDLEDMKASMPSQTTLAALSGVATKVRQVRAAGEAGVIKGVSGVRRRVREGVNKLMGGCKDYLGGCALFKDGGDFAPLELEAVTERVGSLQGEVLSVGEGLEARVVDCEGCLERDRGVWEDFQVAWDKALHALSLAQGIGPKYGAPRRRAMDLIRVATRSGESQEEAIEGRLVELDALCSLWEKAESESQPPFPVAPPNPSSVPPPKGGDSPLDESIAILRATRGLVEASLATTPEAGSGGEGGETVGKKPAAGGKDAKAGGKAAAAAAAVALTVDAPSSYVSLPSTAADEGDPSVSSIVIGLGPEAAKEALRRSYESRRREIDEESTAAMGPFPLSTRIRWALLALRNTLYSRAKVLDALKAVSDREGPPRPLYLPFISASELPPPDASAAAAAAAAAATEGEDGGGGESVDGEVGAEHFLNSSPSMYPAVSEPTAFILPLSTPPASRVTPPLDTPHFVTFLSASFDSLYQAANTPSAPHTIKGPSPGLMNREACALPPFYPAVQSAIAESFAATRELYKSEGVVVGSVGGATKASPPPLPLDIPGGEEGVPEHMVEWGRDALKKARDTRDFGLRRLRVFVERAQALIATRVPAAVVGDVLARARTHSRESALESVSLYRSQASVLERERKEIVGALKLSLGDPNAGESLGKLCSAEASREAAVRGLLQESREAMLVSRRRDAGRFSSTLAHITALLCAVCEEILAPWDLSPLPGDEFIPPTKMSFKKLHKTLRKAGGEAAALAAAVLGDSDAMEDGVEEPVEGSGKVTLLAHQQLQASGAGAAGMVVGAGSGGGGGGKPAAPAAPAKKGGAAAAAAPPSSTTPASTAPPPPPPRGAKDFLAKHTWPGLSPHPLTLFSSTPPSSPPTTPFGAFVCFLGPTSRHATAARDAAFDTYCTEFTEACREIVARFTLARTEAEKWERVWEARVSSVKLNDTLGEYNLTVPVPPTFLLPPPPPPPVVPPLATQDPPPSAGAKGGPKGGKK